MKDGNNIFRVPIHHFGWADHAKSDLRAILGELAKVVRLSVSRAQREASDLRDLRNQLSR